LPINPAEMIKKGKRQSSIATPKQGIELPRWIFEVDEEDEIQGDSSLLEELEIDPAHIYRLSSHYIDNL